MHDHNSNFVVACKKIAELILVDPPKDSSSLYSLKVKVAKEFRLKCVPKNSDVLSMVPPERKNLLQSLLKIKPVRSASGVVVIAVMSRPYPCPQKTPCLYCPGGVQFNTPQSYTGYEPAAARGKEHDYEPYSQVRSRLDQLKAIGHVVQKAELIVMGGTFLHQPIEYQEYFVKGCFDGLNGRPSNSLEEALEYNEKAEVRCVGLTFETRPDFCKEPHVDLMLKYGVTRVEIGVQNPSDSIYRIVGRGHTLKDVKSSFKVAKDSGLKVVAHMMPGLPGSSPRRDLKGFRRLFEDESFKPDMLKIYPTLVVENSKLYQMYVNGEYKPYTEEEMVGIVAEVMSMVPYWVRIMRVQRDIPANLIVAGVRRGNLRELAHERLKEMGRSCHCIRCREIGLLALRNRKFDREEFTLHRIDYKASGGKESFLSYENSDRSALIGFLRLRKPSDKAHRPEVEDASLVRELHIYGLAAPIGFKIKESWQHRGYGRRLLDESERIAKEEHGSSKILVTSAVGTREYYEKLGYFRIGPYMGKKLV